MKCRIIFLDPHDHHRKDLPWSVSLKQLMAVPQQYQHCKHLQYKVNWSTNSLVVLKYLAQVELKREALPPPAQDLLTFQSWEAAEQDFTAVICTALCLLGCYLGIPGLAAQHVSAFLESPWITS